MKDDPSQKNTLKYSGKMVLSIKFAPEYDLPCIVRIYGVSFSQSV